MKLLPVSRAGLLSTLVHRADSPVRSGQPQHRPSRQTLRGVRGSQQRGVEQVPEGLQGGPRNIRDYLNSALTAPLQVIDRGYPALHCAGLSFFFLIVIPQNEQSSILTHPVGSL